MGPYGTNLGDVWLGEGSPVQESLNRKYIEDVLGGSEEPGLVLIHEMIERDGEVQEALYVTSNPEMIRRAAEGHEKWLAARAAEN
jgi:hypothetical protein